MNISLTPELEQLIEDKVKTGLYHSASEVVREALRLLRERDQFQELKLQDLRREIQIGVDQIKKGQVVSEDEVLSRVKVRRDKAVAKKGKRA
jgi:antitoxin ParD1/3/4